jgi:hypothetical protein
MGINARRFTLCNQDQSFSVVSIFGKPNIAKSPSVGIFWGIFKGSDQHLFLINENMALAEAEAYGDFLTYPHGHLEAWEYLRTRDLSAIQRLGLPTELLHREYEDFPRGRVVYSVLADEFTIYADKKLHMPLVINAIVIAFSLNQRVWVLRSDGHYR